MGFFTNTEKQILVFAYQNLVFFLFVTQIEFMPNFSLPAFVVRVDVKVNQQHRLNHRQHF